MHDLLPAGTAELGCKRGLGAYDGAHDCWPVADIASLLWRAWWLICANSFATCCALAVARQCLTPVLAVLLCARALSGVLHSSQRTAPQLQLTLQLAL